MGPPNQTIAELVRRQTSFAASSTPGQGTEDQSEYQAFAFGRVGLRPQMTFVVRFADGRLKGIPYAQMLGIESDDEQAGLRVDFPSVVVEIRGRNLKRLFRYVCDHRAAQIDESTPEQSMAAADNGEVVDSIVIRRQLSQPRHIEQNGAQNPPKQWSGTCG